MSMAPTTVEEYLRQIPNPSPCPHSPSPTQPPCQPCIERRIATATALRAGVDLTQVVKAAPIPPPPAAEPPRDMVVTKEVLGPPIDSDFLPGMTHTPPEPIQEPAAPELATSHIEERPADAEPVEEATDPVGLLASLTGGARLTGADLKGYPLTPTAPPGLLPPTSVEEGPGPVQLEPGDLKSKCPHGMPATDFSSSPVRSASCVTCMEEGPPPALSKLKATRYQLAHFSSPCERGGCGRVMMAGELIGQVPNVGWCCARCTKPDRPT